MTSSTVAGESRTRSQAPPAAVAPDDLRIFKRKPKRKRVQGYRPSPDLLPVLVDEGTYASRRRRSHIDAASLLVLVVILIQLLPSRLVVPDLTSVGRPGLLIGLLLAVWWMLSKLHPRLAMIGPQPMRWAFVVYALTLLLSYAAGQFRGLPVLEANSADRALLGALAFMGIVFMTADGVPTRDRLDDVQRVLVYCTAINAVLGILQFVTKKDLTQSIVIPGLTLQGSWSASPTAAAAASSGSPAPPGTTSSSAWSWRSRCRWASTTPATPRRNSSAGSSSSRRC
ncbi:hypothetical protein [Dactylosporangium cerinum]